MIVEMEQRNHSGGGNQQTVNISYFSFDSLDVTVGKKLLKQLLEPALFVSIQLGVKKNFPAQGCSPCRREVLNGILSNLLVLLLFEVPDLIGYKKQCEQSKGDTYHGCRLVFNIDQLDNKNQRAESRNCASRSLATAIT